MCSWITSLDALANVLGGDSVPFILAYVGLAAHLLQRHRFGLLCDMPVYAAGRVVSTRSAQHVLSIDVTDQPPTLGETGTGAAVASDPLTQK